MRPTYVCTRHHWTGRFIVSRITGAEGTLISATLVRKVPKHGPAVQQTLSNNAYLSSRQRLLRLRSFSWWIYVATPLSLVDGNAGGTSNLRTCRRPELSPSTSDSTQPACADACAASGRAQLKSPASTGGASFFRPPTAPGRFSPPPAHCFWINSTEAHRAWSVQKRKIDSFKLDLTVP